MTTIDLIRIPVDKHGNLLWNIEQYNIIFDEYRKVLPDRQVLMAPANFTVWEDLDISVLKSVRQYLDELIEKKGKRRK